MPASMINQGRAMARSRSDLIHVYVDPGVVALEPERSDASGDPVTVPGAPEALGYLADALHEVVLLGYAEVPRIEGLPADIRVEAELPSHPDAGSWLITDDPDGCGRRAPGLRTILVGPRRAPTNRPTVRCDVEARDLGAAVMEILAREAMA
jgi:hypothetical protein